MKLKIILLVAVLLCIAGCNRSRDCMYLDFELKLTYRDHNNVDLLDTTSIKHYNPDSIKIYFLASDGCVVYYYHKIADNSEAYKGFDIVQTSHSGYVFCLDLIGIRCVSHKHGNTDVNNFDTVSHRTIYIQFNENEIDTVYATFYHVNCWNTYDKIYYNGKLIMQSYPREGTWSNIPTIIKE